MPAERNECTNPAPSFTEIVGEFVEGEHFKKLSDNTQKSYRADLKHFGDFLASSNCESINDIDEKLVRTYLGFQIPNTARRRKTTLYKLFEWYRVRNAPVNPVEGITINLPTEAIPLSKPLTQQEVQILFESNSHHPEIQLYILLAIKTGAWVSNILQLRKSDFSVTTDQVLMITLRKNQKLKFDNQFSTIVSRILKNIPGKGYVFRSEKNKIADADDHLTRQWINEKLKINGEIIGRSDLTPTVFKHTYITNFMGNAQELALALGISNDHADRLMARRALMDNTADYSPETPEA